MVTAELTTENIDRWFPSRPSSSEDGSEVVFRGIVRDSENGRSIRALVYEQYEGMALKQLEKLAMNAVSRFGLSSLDCIHRTGTVPAGEAAVVVVIRSGHRSEGFDAMSWFMDELKKVVPIWKVGSIDS
ncbi:molybdenum cofactor biosynthesis protein MoaE [Prosthecochloris sp. HL-130-GSB]|jgi:molybdopterin synthase catalytic subunit|uniref:Molybdopterin synthase catalytic subunit n=1 Tax=Prosthecochloris aestuarii TaxID=1102 RepID=A0A831SSA2_PROAE|nr:molybdenum cofactor biosynthesis protein MoaE [Prosthecochloris sp. HL-130-GSB]ARM31643.1 molybdopterin biosynthesis protein MoeE [Prosthecochloris sp. HL-130-GSB]MBO8092904.1 molybdenum cofactor biosynthesis protein MoaE [Prosthecochloris sp.]HED30887.1 molybdenum cofactor biosynthesis protein MoaE [Prosthecochloris aestuarii]